MANWHRELAYKDESAEQEQNVMMLEVKLDVKRYENGDSQAKVGET